MDKTGIDYKAAWGELERGLAEVFGTQDGGDYTSMAVIKLSVSAIVESVARKYGIPPQG